MYQGYRRNNQVNEKDRLIHTDVDIYDWEWKDDKACILGIYLTPSVLNTKAIGLKTNNTVKGRRKGAMVTGTTYSNGKESGKVS